MDKKSLTEQDIRTKFITPALARSGWDIRAQIREEVSFTAGRIIVQGRIVTRGKSKRADYILYYKPNIPIAIIEAKDNTHGVGDGMQQALDYGRTLDVPFICSSNGNGYYMMNIRNLGGVAKMAIPKLCINWGSRPIEAIILGISEKDFINDSTP